MDLQQLYSRVRRCVDEYAMIEAGDRIAVGVSGGKDSLCALVGLAGLARFYPKKFEVVGITLDLGYGADWSPVADLCRELGVEYRVVPTQIKQIVFDVRKESNPCALCANLRRGALNTAALSAGCGKVALGHHTDDAVETFLMSLIYEGRLATFAPVTYLDRTGITVLRPLLYCREYETRSFAAEAALPVTKNPCPADGGTKRQRVKEIAAGLREERADIYEKIFGAIRRCPLKGWEEPLTKE
jgi:tRNA(Ile)-lysidine synthase TilS/MesJ